MMALTPKETDRTEKENMLKKESYLVSMEVENDSNIETIQNAVMNRFDHEIHSNPKVIGNLCPDSHVLTVTGHLLQLFRKHGVCRNEREMVLSYDDTLVAVQLCLAEHNKQQTGDFDVTVSKVIEMHKYLVEDKLGQLVDKSLEYQTLRQNYDEYLQNCNLIDCVDVMVKLQDEMKVNEALQREIQYTNFVVLNHTSNKVEKSMLCWLAEGKQCFTATIECSLDESITDSGTYVFEPCDVNTKFMILDSRTIRTPGNIGGRSATESYAENVLMSYLHLLGNTRSELALAMVLNIPERDLNHKAFTCVKREARKKKMSMYQAIVSHVMRIRLGGKSYAPDPNSALNQHVKGLAEFTDLVQRLTTIIEEDSNTRSAIRRILNILKNTIIKCKDNNINKHSVECITSKLQKFAEKTIDVYEKVEEESPKRDAQNGGSLVGRRTLRVIQAIVDRHCSRLPSNSHMDCLTDIFSSQATPIRFPSLMSKFRSPLEASPGSMESQSLTERMRQKMSTQQCKKPVVPRFQSNMNWALPLHDVGLGKNNRSVVIDDFMPSKTIVHPATCNAKREQSSTYKVLESLHDQENEMSNQEITYLKDTTSDSHNSNIKKGSHKRTLSTSSQISQPAQKKSKKSATTKSNKKKTLPLIKGQKQLTAFFRV